MSMEIAKELTLAAINKMDLRITSSRMHSEHNDFVAAEVSKVFEEIYKTVQLSYAKY